MWAAMAKTIAFGVIANEHLGRSVDEKGDSAQRIELELVPARLVLADIVCEPAAKDAKAAVRLVVLKVQRDSGAATRDGDHAHALQVGIAVALVHLRRDARARRIALNRNVCC
jgi:hypothetical protein